ncbi:MAG: oxidoreductase [Nocardioidaceae bacterium]|nr:oxidoreductase [Nocardioidaceae bacterium]
MTRPTLYDAAGGGPAMYDLAHAWHQRVLADPVVSHAFSHGFHPDHSARLAAYFGEQLGGPATYSERIGDQSFVVRLHAGNGEHHELSQRALACFVEALDDCRIPPDPDLRQALTDWFTHGIGLMDAYPDSPDDVPDGLAIPRWGWEGPSA